MSFRVPRSAFRIFLALTILAGLSRFVAAQADLASDLLSRINVLRTQNGLLPLAVSDQLSAAAQRHSSDMATTGNVSHSGSDGSTMDSRVRASGYGFWRTFGIWGENIYGGQNATVDDAWAFWNGSPDHRSNLISTRYREIGVGVATGDKGTYFTLNFGAQPNVLPFFVAGTPPDVTLLLTNEDNITTGDGVTVMGQATEIRIGEGTDLSNLAWQPWAATVSFKLSDTPGAHTLTVELRDELKRGTKMTRVVNVADLAAATATLTPTLTSTPRVTATTTPRGTATLQATAANTPRPIGTAASTPTDTTTPQATATSAATVTPAATSTHTTTPTPIATATSEPTLVPSSVATVTPEPTLTAIPRAIQRATSSPTARAVAIAFPTSVGASRLTPPAPRPAPTERPLIALFDRAPNNVLVLICGLQVIALSIGVLALAARAIGRRKA